jgi:hypothetical protein
MAILAEKAKGRRVSSENTLAPPPAPPLYRQRRRPVPKRPERQRCTEHKTTDFLFHDFLFCVKKCAPKRKRRAAQHVPVSMKKGGRRRPRLAMQCTLFGA